MAQIKFKRGDTFTLTCTYKVDGVATSVSALTIESQIRNQRDTLIQNLVVTKLVGTGQFTLIASAEDTTEWPVSVLRCDIQFSEGGVVRSTQTFDISVVEEVTK